MRLYEIPFPEIDCMVKFKVLDPPEVVDFIEELSTPGEELFETMPKSVYMQKVLVTFIYNMNIEIKNKLKSLSPMARKVLVDSLYNGCIFLNPGLDLELWMSLSSLTIEVVTSPEATTDLVKTKETKKPAKEKKKVSHKAIPRSKITSFKNVIKKRVVGQDEAVQEIYSSLKRSLAGLTDGDRPQGVFLFAGSSGVGKTHLAKVLHEHLYGAKVPLARIDCGEFQEKHQAITLLGAPPSYIGYDAENGGILSQIIESNPSTVLLLDEVEKAHPSIWNVFLRIFDEGKMTDSRGTVLDFKKCIIIMTTNLGNDKVVRDLTGKSAGFNARVNTKTKTQEIPPHSSVVESVNKAIKDHFKPEFLNRIDNTIIFRHLELSEYRRIAELELVNTTKKLSTKGIKASFDNTVIDGLITEGVDTIQGARGMASVRRNRIENPMADLIIDYNLKKGSVINVKYDKDFSVEVDLGKVKVS